MKRAEKIAVLTKVMQGTNSETARKHLQHALETAPRSLIIIDDLDDHSSGISDNDPIHFYDRGVEHRMTLQEAHEYARRNHIGVLIVLPEKRS